MPLARPHVPNLYLGARAAPVRVPSPAAALGAASPLACPSPRQGASRGVLLGCGVGSSAAPPNGCASVGVTPRLPAGPGMAPQPTYGHPGPAYAAPVRRPDGVRHGSPSPLLGEYRFRSASPLAGGAAGSGLRHCSAGSEARSGSLELRAPSESSLQELEREQAELEGQLKMMRLRRRSAALRGEVETERILAEVHALQQQQQFVVLEEEKAKLLQRQGARQLLESTRSSSDDVIARSARLRSPRDQPGQRHPEAGGPAAGPSQAPGTEPAPDAAASPQRPPAVLGRDSLCDERSVQGSPHSAVLRADHGPPRPPASPAAAWGCGALGSTSGTVEAAADTASGEASASADCAAGLRQPEGAREAEVPPLPAGPGRGGAPMPMGAVMWTPGMPNSSSRRTVPKA
ncbi:unnamed protein product [Prorocentrum cordatum]|uniref:Uncharacterized protein n=1 Tax=Prorocentrum cordatum TaxID=2364126 RepID=A0ABN9S7L1_9DINO|nr:unnamed protein product [Polarella glacialis]